MKVFPKCFVGLPLRLIQPTGFVILLLERYRKDRKGGGRKGFPEMSAAMDGRRQAHMDVLVAVSGKPFLPSPHHRIYQATKRRPTPSSAPNTFCNQPPTLVEVSRRQPRERGADKPLDPPFNKNQYKVRAASRRRPGPQALADFAFFEGLPYLGFENTYC